MDREPTDKELKELKELEEAEAEAEEAYNAAPLNHLELFMSYRREYYAIQAIKAYAKKEEAIPTELIPSLIKLCDDWTCTKGNIGIAKGIELKEQWEIKCEAVDFELSNFGSSKSIIEACKKVCNEEEDPQTLASEHRKYRRNKNR